MDSLADHPRYSEARRRARSLRGFHIHALVYVAVVAGVFALETAGAPIRHWPGWRKIREYLERRP